MLRNSASLIFSALEAVGKVVDSVSVRLFEDSDAHAHIDFHVDTHVHVDTHTHDEEPKFDLDAFVKDYQSQLEAKALKVSLKANVQAIFDLEVKAEEAKAKAKAKAEEAAVAKVKAAAAEAKEEMEDEAKAEAAAEAKALAVLHRELEETAHFQSDVVAEFNFKLKQIQKDLHTPKQKRVSWDSKSLATILGPASVVSQTKATSEKAIAVAPDAQAEPILSPLKRNFKFDNLFAKRMSCSVTGPSPLPRALR
jgi:hypothetical protein